MHSAALSVFWPRAGSNTATMLGAPHRASPSRNFALARSARHSARVIGCSVILGLPCPIQRERSKMAEVLAKTSSVSPSCAFMFLNSTSRCALMLSGFSSSSGGSSGLDDALLLGDGADGGALGVVVFDTAGRGRAAC